MTQCAPALAGLKPANLFRWVEPDAAGFWKTVKKWQQVLAPKGLSVCVLKECPVTKAFLVYVYRAPQIEVILAQPGVQAYLGRTGYRAPGKLAPCLETLSRRLCCEERFPHEIGIFLGYPLEDVVGFVENKGKNYTCCGYWKTYGDPAAAREKFAQYRKCTEVYLRCYAGGAPLTRLAVAG